MECPYCGAELIYDDYYGKKKYADHYYIYPQSWIEKEGDIYKCPNSEYYSEEYIQEALETTGKVIQDCECCDSGCFNGYFYTDRNGNLHEGYPC